MYFFRLIKKLKALNYLLLFQQLIIVSSSQAANWYTYDFSITLNMKILKKYAKEGVKF